MVGVLVHQPLAPKSENPTSSNSTTRMFGAPCGGFGADGHHGFEPATVLPIVPPNGFALPAAMHSSRFLDATRGCSAGSPGPRHARPRALPKTIIRIMIM